MIQGTMSGAGKSTLVAALCRILSDMGHDVAPFKSQNMSSFTHDAMMVSRAQAVQAQAARCPVSLEINPVLLVPRSDDSSEVFVMGESRGVMDTAEYYRFAEREAMRAATGALERLRRGHEIIVIEGAGSPAEINVPYDMANMRVAEAAGAPVVIVADIERGGCFAQMAGTMALLPKEHSRRVAGFVINKFRGDASILEGGIERIRRLTGKDTLGVIPYMRSRLPSEDSLDYHATAESAEQSIRTISETVKSSMDIEAILGGVP